jgi:hypothetical protein
MEQQQQNIARAIAAGINLLDGREPLPIAPKDLEALAQLKNLLLAIVNGQLVIASPEMLKETTQQEEN